MSITADAPQISQYLTQEVPGMLFSEMSSTMLMRMMEQVNMPPKIFSLNYRESPSLTCILYILFQGSQSTFASQPTGPLPDSFFITTNKPLPRPVALTTATKEGKAAAKKRKSPKEHKATRAKKKSASDKHK